MLLHSYVSDAIDAIHATDGSDGSDATDASDASDASDATDAASDATDAGSGDPIVYHRNVNQFQGASPRQNAQHAQNVRH